jgi:hypothetical protein
MAKESFKQFDLEYEMPSLSREVKDILQSIIGDSIQYVGSVTAPHVELIVLLGLLKIGK